MQRRRSVSLDTIVAFSPLIIGFCLLLVGLFAWISYSRLLGEHPSHAATLRLMDGLQKVVPKLESAVADLMDYEFPYSPYDSSDPANPRHAAVNVRRAAVALKKAVGGSGQLAVLLEELEVLHRKLKRADVLRGELGYEPFRRRIQQALSTCEWAIAQLANLVPDPVLESRKRLKGCSGAAFKLSALFLTIGALFFYLWVRGLRERGHVGRQCPGS
jgi:hypothetical protein